jgi:L-alanine-DL-glutamate epimerase-like enolase superfamily enzyme
VAADLRISGVKVTALVFRAPIATPVRTAFGTMQDRPMVLVRAEDRDGVVGWGEIWCNFPAVGAEHRARLLADMVAPVLEETDFDSPADAFLALERQFEVLAIQTGEPGPLAQVIAGVDIALWDLVARRNALPVSQLLGAEVTGSVPCYASGINPDAPERTVAVARAAGFTAFKLKIGFGRERDLANLSAVSAGLGAGEMLMADSNQGWTVDTALEMLAPLAGFGLKWLEEPIRADSSPADWQRIRNTAAMPLAAGENLRGKAAFEAELQRDAIAIVQPDLGKWGGFSGCLPVARAALAAGRRYCPHWLGGGIGLMASAHLLAAAGGDGLLEVDVNPNPLREAVLPKPAIAAGRFHLPAGPGLGIEPDFDALAPFRVHWEKTA